MKPLDFTISWKNPAPNHWLILAHSCSFLPQIKLLSSGVKKSSILSWLPHELANTVGHRYPQVWKPRVCKPDFVPSRLKSTTCYDSFALGPDPAIVFSDELVAQCSPVSVGLLPLPERCLGFPPYSLISSNAEETTFGWYLLTHLTLTGSSSVFESPYIFDLSIISH